METLVRNSVLSTSDRDRLADLLASAPAWRRWAVEHRNAPLLCALGLLDAPDADYAHAAQRRFGDPLEARGRALALIQELDHDDREERYEQWRDTRRRRWAVARSR